jgi:hypothetical protein
MPDKLSGVVRHVHHPRWRALRPGRFHRTQSSGLSRGQGVAPVPVGMHHRTVHLRRVSARLFDAHHLRPHGFPAERRRTRAADADKRLHRATLHFMAPTRAPALNSIEPWAIMTHLWRYQHMNTSIWILSNLDPIIMFTPPRVAFAENSTTLTFEHDAPVRRVNHNETVMRNGKRGAVQKIQTQRTL